VKEACQTLETTVIIQIFAKLGRTFSNDLRSNNVFVKTLFTCMSSPTTFGNCIGACGTLICDVY
jgi:hypothetical protein